MMLRKQIARILQSFVVYAVIAVSVALVVIVLDTLGAFNTLKYSTRDLRFRFRGVEPHVGNIEIVGIDPQTLEMLGIFGMPPRDYHVKLIENLYKAGAKAVMFDVLFLSYSGTSTDEDGMMSSAISYEDSLLADALRRYPNTIIGRKLVISVDESSTLTSGEAHMPPPAFRNRDQLAFVDMYLDSDGFLRRTKLFAEDLDGTQFADAGWEYSFALKAVMLAAGIDTAWVDYRHRTAHVGDIEVPLDESGFMYINYAMDEPTFQNSGGYTSYEQVLDDSEWGLGPLIESGRFKDKVVLVGAAWPESGDTKQTPFFLGTDLLNFKGTEYPMFGVHVHKNICTTLLGRRFIHPFTRFQAMLLIMVMAVLATIINALFRGFKGLFISLGIMIGYFAASALIFEARRLLVPVIAPGIFTVALAYVGTVTYHFLAERKQKAMIRGAFAQYVPPSVVGELIKNPDKLTLGGEEREMTVIFSDVAGFTTISEKLTPQQLVELLNEYLTIMTDIVLSYNGIIDKYEGDAIMAEFGAPLPDPDHALQACHVALDMQKALVELRAKLESEGRPIIYARVGINSGAMVIGNMGSSRIFDYTVMGDNVNLGSRLEGANKVYGTYIMCSEATRKLVEHAIITRELDLLRVKGKTTGVLVHEVIARVEEGVSVEKRKVLDLYTAGLAAYKQRQWDGAASLFSDALSIDPQDTPSSVYLDRCREFADNPPPPDWDGIFTMRTK